MKPSLDISIAQQRELDRVVVESLKPFSGYFALLYAVLACAHWLLIADTADRAVMTTIAVSSAIVFGTCWRVMESLRLDSRHAHLLAVAAGSIVLTNCLAHLYCSEQPEQSTNITLVIIGTGCVFLSVRWWVFFIAVTIGSWVAVGYVVGPKLLLPHYAFAQFSALIVSLTVLTVRIRTYRHLFELRRNEAERAVDLELALASAEVHRIQGQMLIDSAFDAMVMVDSEGRIRDWNERTEKVLGCEGEKLRNRNVTEAMIAPEHHAAFASKLSGETVPQASRRLFEAVAVRANGERFPVEVALAASNEGPGIASIVCLRDISERQRSLVLVEEASKAKSAFLATMSHELRTPLNAIIGYSEMIAEEMSDEALAVHRKDLQRIRQSGQHLLALVNDLLDLSKIEAGRLTLSRAQFDPEAVMNEVAETLMPLAIRNHNVIGVESRSPIGLIRGDVVRFRQSLMNLCANACKFTNGGRVDLTAWRELRAGAEWIVFEVADTGSGISEEDLALLFNPYRQAGEVTKRSIEGTGLGLVIARHFCRLMGGDIKVESTLGQGSRFRIELPATTSSDASNDGNGSQDLANLAVQLAVAQPEPRKN